MKILNEFLIDFKIKAIDPILDFWKELKGWKRRIPFIAGFLVFLALEVYGTIVLSPYLSKMDAVEIFDIHVGFTWAVLPCFLAVGELIFVLTPFIVKKVKG